MSQAWFRLYAEFATDPKVQMMSEVMQRRLIMLFCLRCSDVTVTASDDEIAFQLRISAEDLAETKALFIRKGFIDSSWNIVKWNELTGLRRPAASIWRRLREAVFQRDDFTCQYCGAHGGKLECDHVIPVARGGGHNLGNLVTACFTCNRSKRAKLLEEWRSA